MKTINFSHPKGTAPKAARKGSKTEKLIQLASRPQGVTLTALAKALTAVGGAEVTPSYARAWVAKSYLQPLGYGVKSTPTKNGKDLVIFVTSSGMAADTSRSDVAKPKKATKKTEAAKTPVPETKEEKTEEAA